MSGHHPSQVFHFGGFREHFRRQSSHHSSQQGSNFIALSNTFTGYNDWITTNVGDGLGNAAAVLANGRRLPTPTPILPADREQAFHTETRLTDGRPAILIDPGSVGNLGGGDWAREVAKVAMQHNRILPVAIRRIDGTHSRSTFQIPVVNHSILPGLLGLQSMRDRNAILDMQTLRLHLCGPGDYDLLPALPPGTESFQCELAPSGHLVLPCSEYAGVDREEAGSLDTGADIALLSNTASQIA